jgi:hypothetical protein
VRTAFKAAIHSKHVQRFRDSLNDAKSTLTLAMVHERYVAMYLSEESNADHFQRSSSSHL